jgi:selenocysteine lyase/cysteine desulfurase
MLGDIAPLKEMVAVAKKHGAMIAVDEAHGMGFFGANGRGVFEEAGVSDDVDFVIGTFSKSVGTVGGFIVSNHPKFEVMRLVCRPYVFTASLPPSVVATAATSIRKLMHAADKRAHLWKNSRRLHKGLRDLGFNLATAEPESAIIAVILPDQQTTVLMWQALLEQGVYVNMARPPATPAGMYLLRCSLCADHSDEQVSRILEMFTAAGRATGSIAVKPFALSLSKGCPSSAPKVKAGLRQAQPERGFLASPCCRAPDGLFQAHALQPPPVDPCLFAVLLAPAGMLGSMRPWRCRRSRALGTLLGTAAA